jgi:hypothetical protein
LADQSQRTVQCLRDQVAARARSTEEAKIKEVDMNMKEEDVAINEEAF